MATLVEMIEQGRLRLGMTKAAVRALLGPPGAWGNTSRKYREPSTWLYGRIELWFERHPYRVPRPGPCLVGVYTEDDDQTEGRMLLQRK